MTRIKALHYKQSYEIIQNYQLSIIPNSGHEVVSHRFKQIWPIIEHFLENYFFRNFYLKCYYIQINHALYSSIDLYFAMLHNDIICYFIDSFKYLFSSYIELEVLSLMYCQKYVVHYNIDIRLFFIKSLFSSFSALIYLFSSILYCSNYIFSIIISHWNFPN